MKTKLLPLAALAVSALALSAAASGGNRMAPMSFAATLNAGQEVPHPKGTKSGAAGKFTATVKGTTITWKLTFAHLTGSATAAHIHAGKKGVPGAVLIALCGPCSSPASGSGTITSEQLKQLESGNTYVNVHTTKNAGGEIRGQIRSSM
jgi:hypothetical protein